MREDMGKTKWDKLITIFDKNFILIFCINVILFDVFLNANQ